MPSMEHSESPAWIIGDPAFPELAPIQVASPGCAIPRLIDTDNCDFVAQCAEIADLSGADGIVTFLYKNEPKVLRKFLDIAEVSVFRYTWRHKNFENTGGVLPFIISRKKNIVKAGYKWGYDDNALIDLWDLAVSYEILPNGEWKLQGLSLDGLNRPRPYEQGRKPNENGDFGFEIMKTAISSRLWQCLGQGDRHRIEVLYEEEQGNAAAAAPVIHTPQSSLTSAQGPLRWRQDNNPDQADLSSVIPNKTTRDANMSSINQTERSSTDKPWLPLGKDGFSNSRTASATCYCGTVQLEFITASVFASNLIIKDDFIKHLRGKEKLTKFSQDNTIATGNTMSNYFCSVCGTLMYRVSSGFPGKSILRLGTVDDFNLQETKLKPRVEQFCKDRVAWFKGGEGVRQEDGNFYC
ncbi:putative CENP-V/GFA domain-containing protein [Seiridium unicorne]|uniref:CENP-V/GFA domain-containing protein n=1 Tax=Seiridium unicorne TaxID=138068 RepID=A0ABR2VG98_9PEZI